MSVKYLDLNGLEIYSGKVKSLLDKKADKDIIIEICNELTRITSLNIKEVPYFIVGNDLKNIIEFNYILNDVNYTINIPANSTIKIDITEEINSLYFFDYDYDFYNNDFTSLDLTKLNTSNITDMSNMFNRCYELLSLNLSNFNTSNVVNMERMFYDCISLTSLDLRNFDTSTVTNMRFMFDNCNSLTSLDLSNFDISNVIYQSQMFTDCIKLNYIKCKQAFKNWCIINQDDISLPYNMREVGRGTWDIID